MKAKEFEGFIENVEGLLRQNLLNCRYSIKDGHKSNQIVLKVTDNTKVKCFLRSVVRKKAVCDVCRWKKNRDLEIKWVSFVDHAMDGNRRSTRRYECVLLNCKKRFLEAQPILEDPTKGKSLKSKRTKKG